MCFKFFNFKSGVSLYYILKITIFGIIFFIIGNFHAFFFFFYRTLDNEMKFTDYKNRRIKISVFKI